MFTVWSAYKLAATLNRNTSVGASNSSSATGNISIYMGCYFEIGRPERIKIFGWRVATSNLATKRNKCTRTIIHDSVCDICGNGDEDEFHAVISCTKSKALRFSMRKVWGLPDEKEFFFSYRDKLT